MSKFETTKTLMYKFLLKEVEDELYLAKQRAEDLLKQNDYDHAKKELDHVIELKGDISILQKLLEKSQKETSKIPWTLVSRFSNRFGNTTNHIAIDSEQLDDTKYYYEDTGIALKDWKELEAGKYIVNNLSLDIFEDIFNKTILGKYPHEQFWYPIDDFDIWNGRFKDIKNNNIYKKG